MLKIAIEMPPKGLADSEATLCGELHMWQAPIVARLAWTIHDLLFI
jgi:hypothetical protein